MLKRLLNLFLISITAFILICGIITPVFAIEESEDFNNQNQIETVSSDSVKVNDLDIEPLNTKKIKDSVVPNSKNEGKKVFKLFLKTMSAVLISVVILYFILLLIKRFNAFNSFQKDDENDEYDYYDLSTPSNKKEALKNFLNKTK